MVVYVIKTIYAFFHVCRSQNNPVTDCLSRLPIETKVNDPSSHEDWLTDEGMFNLSQEYTFKKLIQEMPDQLGKIFEEVEAKQKIGQAKTICDP
jgi:hypothetical protein